MDRSLGRLGRASLAEFGGATRTTNLDLLLAPVVALGLPVVALWLLQATGGALASLVLYYLICGVVLVRWRKGTLDYRWPERWPWLLFGVSLLGPLAVAAINWFSLPRAGGSPLGVALTALVWAPLNAAYEQLSWLYVLDAWRNRWTSGWQRWLGLAVGILLILVLVGLIHVVFWIRFLPAGPATGLAALVVPINTAMTAAFALLYYRSRSLWPTFIVHLLLDLQLVLIAHYAILPDL